MHQSHLFLRDPEAQSREQKRRAVGYIDVPTRCQAVWPVLLTVAQGDGPPTCPLLTVPVEGLCPNTFDRAHGSDLQVCLRCYWGPGHNRTDRMLSGRDAGQPAASSGGAIPVTQTCQSSASVGKEKEDEGDEIHILSPC